MSNGDIDLSDLDDSAPLLLLPVRLEARFGETEGRRQLWVRVFPDACWVDTFDPRFTDAELTDVAAYWAARWAAAGHTAERRSAWAGLVAAHGAGRAGYLVDARAPVNGGDEPATRAADELVLAAATTEEPTAGEATALAAYWAAVWRANRDAHAVARARADLAAAVGEARAGDLVAGIVPANLAADPPAGTTRETARLTVAVARLPAVGADQRRRQAWSTPAVVRRFPQHLRLLGYRAGQLVLDQVGERIPDPLPVGPDPTAPEGTIAVGADGGLVLPDELTWLVDFQRAVTSGLGFRVDLDDTQGFDRLLVLGVHVGGDAADGAAAMAELLTHHRDGVGFALVPQGSPTNNTDGHPSPYRRRDDPDATYDLVHSPAPVPAPPGDRLGRTDGQLFTEALGLPARTLRRVAGAAGTDRREAAAMNRLLWPATLGYFMDALMGVPGGPGSQPEHVVPDEAAESLQDFQADHVSGRGPVSAVRIGAQPYGILPTTAWSRLRWPENPPDLPDGGRLPFVRGLHRVLARLRAEWTALAQGAARLGDEQDPGAGPVDRLLRVLGLHPASVEFSQRYAETRTFRHNLFLFWSAALATEHRERSEQIATGVLRLLQALGYPGGGRPELADLLFLDAVQRLDGPVVDDAPLSETEPLPPAGGGRNYLAWLRDTARDSFDRLRQGAGLDPEPRSLLYLLAKFAVERGYETEARHILTEELDPDTLLATRFEPPFVHIGRAQDSQSRWRTLYLPQERLTGDDRPMHELVTARLQGGELRGRLPAQLDALDLLDIPTARLERVFVEHLDLCGYRLDAWLTGILSFQLEQMRFPDPAGGPREGLHVGGYGWLLDVRPGGQQPDPATVDEQLDAALGGGDDVPPLLTDPASGGRLLAPSPDHGATAAVLRAGYLSAAAQATPEALAVDLASDRVRRARSLLEGIRSGQPLGALLGYQLERGLHDREAMPELHTAIYALREAFPLRSHRLTETQPPDGTPQEAVDARNVVDGQRLLDQVVSSGQPSWPYGTALPALAAPLTTAVDREVARLREVHDAVADLALAEGVHQLVAGNPERAAATLDAFSAGGLPPDPDVAATPQQGTGVTHRVVLHLDPDALPGATPRSVAEPALNAWLRTVLPPLDRIGCRVSAVTPDTGADEIRTITAAELGWEPIDLLHELDLDDAAQRTALDDALLGAFLTRTGIRPDATVVLEHTVTMDGLVTFFQLAPLVRALRGLLLGARRLSGADLLVPSDPRAGTAATAVLDPARVSTPLSTLADVRAPLVALRDEIHAATGPGAGTVDGWARRLLEAAAVADSFGMAVAGTGQVHDRRREIVAALVGAASTTAVRLGNRLAAFAADLAAADALPAGTSEPERVAALVAAQRRVSTVAADPASGAAAVRAAALADRDVLAARREVFAGVAGTAVGDPGAIADALTAAVKAQPPLEVLTGETVDLEPVQRLLTALPDELARQLDAVVAEIDRRTTAAGDLLATGQVAAAGAELFGPAFPLTPVLTPTDDVAGELATASAAPDELTRYLREDLDQDDPVADWLHGLARVRAPMKHWETVTLLAEPLHRRAGTAPPTASVDLRPAQLPRADGASWLAMQFPPDQAPEREHLLYTSAGVKPAGRLCGVVLDEWHEIIPTREHTAAMVFHHDRPESEPPQAWLLVTPATWSGRWDVDDVVGALHDTLDLAAERAVEPDLLDPGPLSPLLPTTVLPVHPFPISMMVDLALNSRRYAEMREA
jgi:hypothetical protein